MSPRKANVLPLHAMLCRRDVKTSVWATRVDSRQGTRRTEVALRLARYSRWLIGVLLRSCPPCGPERAKTSQRHRGCGRHWVTGCAHICHHPDCGACEDAAQDRVGSICSARRRTYVTRGCRTPIVSSAPKSASYTDTTACCTKLHRAKEAMI